MNNRNWIIFSIAYLAIVLLVSAVIFSGQNILITGSFSKIGLMAVNLFIISPGLSGVVVLVFYRLQQFFKTKDATDFLMPPGGTEGNPSIDNVVGKKGVKALNIIVILLIVLLIIVFIFSIMNSI